LSKETCGLARLRTLRDSRRRARSIHGPGVGNRSSRRLPECGISGKVSVAWPRLECADGNAQRNPAGFDSGELSINAVSRLLLEAPEGFLDAVPTYSDRIHSRILVTP